MLFVIFCCTLYPQQVQTRLKEIYQKRTRRQQKCSKIDQKCFKNRGLGALGVLLGAILAPRQVLTAKTIKNISVFHDLMVKSIKNTREYSNFVVFGPSPGPPKRDPFGSLFASCCHPGAPWGRKCTILGGSGCRVPFWTDFRSFWEGVGILSLFGTILGVILEPKSPQNCTLTHHGPPLGGHLDPFWGV